MRVDAAWHRAATLLDAADRDRTARAITRLPRRANRASIRKLPNFEARAAPRRSTRAATRGGDLAHAVTAMPRALPSSVSRRYCCRRSTADVRRRQKNASWRCRHIRRSAIYGLLICLALSARRSPGTTPPPGERHPLDFAADVRRHLVARDLRDPRPRVSARRAHPNRRSRRAAAKTRARKWT